MASVCRRQLSTNEKRGVQQDLDLWRSKLVHCVGVQKILELLYGTRLLEDFRLFRNYKPASVSNWSFDENCLFCCLRRKKVKEHVVALNNKIVESGGKPLLGKDNSNISRLEWQVEEFLNAVLHRKEYTPRIPDPHIPVVACDTMQQMIGQLLVHYTSVPNSQDSPQHNGNKKDQSLLKTSCVTSTTITSAATSAAASAQNPVLSKLLMADQDTPLDLSVKKVKTEFTEQDGVLDLSMKRNRSSENLALSSPHKTLPNPLITRDSLDPSPTKVRDLQSASTMEQFMAKLCLHHQRQVVDAFGFLQTEVKAVSSPSPVSQKPTTSCSSLAAFEEPSRIQRPEKTHALPVAINAFGVQESSVVKSKELPHVEQPVKEEPSTASVKPVPSINIKAGIRDDILSSSEGAGAECISTKVQPKCPTLLIVKNRRSGSHEAKTLPQEESRVKHPNTGTLEQDSCTSDMRLQASSSESDIVELSSSSVVHGHTESKHCALQKSLSAPSKASPERACTVQRTSNVISPISTRTARKTRRGSQLQQRESSGCHVIVRDPDIGCDIVYVGKPITECGLQSRSYLLPRKNARKSTRGHLYIGECCELKTVRTLARKSAENGSGNCPVPMLEMTTSVTPKQALSKPDGVPPVDMPCTGDCMETAINKKPSDQPMETDVPGDVIEMATEDLIVETTQTDQIQRNEQVSFVPSNEQSDPAVQQDLNAEMLEIVADDTDGLAKQTSAEVCNEAEICVPTQEVKLTTEKTLDTPISDVVMGGLKTDQDQNVATEALLNPLSSDVAKDGASDAEGICVEKDLKDQDATTGDCQTEAPEQTESLEMQETATTDQNGQSQITCENELNIKPADSVAPTQDKVVESEMSVGVKEMSTKEQPKKQERLLPNTIDSPRKDVAPSDRRLRSRASKSAPEQIPLIETPGPTETQSDNLAKNQKTPESKRPLKAAKLKNVESVAYQDDQCNVSTTDSPNLENVKKSPVVLQKESMTVTENMVCTRNKQKLMMLKESESDKEPTGLELSSQKDDKAEEQVCVSNPENTGVTPPTSVDSPGKSGRASERMPLRNSSRLVEQPGKKGSSPIKTTIKSSERMPLRNRNSSAVDQPVVEDSSSSTTGQLEKLGRMPLRSRDSHNAAQVVSKDLSISPSRSSAESVVRMPLRSRNSSTDPPVSRDSANAMKDASNSVVEQPSTDVNLSGKKPESSGRMPLRSGNGSVEQPPSSALLESPGRMPLRSGNGSVEQPPNSALSESPGRMPLRSGNGSVEQPPNSTLSESPGRMPLRSGNGSVEQPPNSTLSESPGRMPLRSGNSSVEQPPNSALSESPGRMPLRSGNGSVEQPPSSDLLESPGRMPLRSGNGSVEQPPNSALLESPGRMPLRSGNGSVEQPPNSTLSESPGRMPLRSGNGLGEQQPNSTLLESPGRMSLRRSNAPIPEKESLLTPPKNKKLSQKPQKISKTSSPSSVLEVEQIPNSPSNVKFKTDKPQKDQVKAASLPDHSFIPVNLPTTVDPVNPCHSKFLEALNGEENQHLIMDLNTKFDKMQKGWVQMDKEGQPAPKPKNKSDRLKEIWKSKRRIRKPRSLEQQKFSPVQMLFMKSFDLPSICRWFLQSTETKSLVIVKKVNTRLPSETQLCFHSSAAVPGSSNGVFPSLQAERLKKHLKKFAIASPVKSNPKTKRLIAKALARGLSASKVKDEEEPTTATRISTKPHCYTGLMPTQPPENLSKVPANPKNPASARILRKYSNMREKMQVQQNTLKNLKSSLKKPNKMSAMPKKVSKDPPTGRGRRSAIVKKVKALAKKAKVKSAVKERTAKNIDNKALRGLKSRDAGQTKKTLPKVSKVNPVAESKTSCKKEVVVKSVKSPQTKTDVKKSPSTRSLESLPSASHAADVKAQISEDQVLTRSQRKNEATLAQTGSPKPGTKRAAEPSPTSAKRTRTSK